jgi:hypothetical protein
MLENTNATGEENKIKCNCVSRCLIALVVKTKYLASYAPFTT